MADYLWHLRAWWFFTNRINATLVQGRWAWGYVKSLRAEGMYDGFSPRDAVLEDMSYWSDGNVGVLDGGDRG